eukprot:688087-Amphidinium_carterae.1
MLGELRAVSPATIQRRLRNKLNMFWAVNLACEGGKSTTMCMVMTSQLIGCRRTMAPGGMLFGASCKR